MKTCICFSQTGCPVPDFNYTSVFCREGTPDPEFTNITTVPSGANITGSSWTIADGANATVLAGWGPGSTFSHHFSSEGPLFVTLSVNGTCADDTPFSTSVSHSLNYAVDLPADAYFGTYITDLSTVNFYYSGTPLADYQGQPVTYSIDFDDGSPLYNITLQQDGTPLPFNHTYLNIGYYHPLIHYGIPGCMNTKKLDLVIENRTIYFSDMPPGFTYSCQDQCVGTPITFNVQAHVSDMPYNWTFGDGSPYVSNTPVVTHTFTKPGIYSVGVGAYNGAFGYAQFIEIFPDDKCKSNCPVPGFTIPFDICRPNFPGPSQLFNTTWIPPGIDPSTVKYDWDFGDPASGSNKDTSQKFQPKHQFTGDDPFKVKLTVTAVCKDGNVHSNSVEKYIRYLSQLPDGGKLNLDKTYGPSTLTVNFDYTGPDLPAKFNNVQALYMIDFGDGSLDFFQPPSIHTTHDYQDPGTYVVTFKFGQMECFNWIKYIVTVVDSPPPPPPPCKECISSFAPIPGNEYVLSAWVKESNPAGKILFTDPTIILKFEGPASQGFPRYEYFKAKQGDKIIDGWQKIEKEFFVPPSSKAVNVRLKNSGTSSDVFFDDIRIFPFDATMKSFVYDPLSLKLMAEMDERNYSTFYEYDEEGALIRVKKETERGIMTIKETKNSTRKRNY